VRTVVEARAIAGRGLAGDRYERGAGTFSDWPQDHEFTLIEAEAVEAALAEFPGLDLAPGDHRRNVTTRGVRLNALVRKRFRIGADVLCEGTRLCEPCAHLEVVTARAACAGMLAGRGGLRARLLTGGTIRVGDPSRWRRLPADVNRRSAVLALAYWLSLASANPPDSWPRCSGSDSCDRA
jgi:hypothetical protein